MNPVLGYLVPSLAGVTALYIAGRPETCLCFCYQGLLRGGGRFSGANAVTVPLTLRWAIV